MRSIKIDNLKDILDFKVGKYDLIKINALIFAIYIKTDYLYRCLNDFSLIELYSEKSLGDSKSFLNAYIQIVAGKNFELVEITKKDNYFSYTFRWLGNIIIDIPQTELNHTIPLRYRVVDNLNNLLIKIHIQPLIKKIALRLIGILRLLK
jgi:hypothetical protein